MLNSREDRFYARPTTDLCKFATITKWTLKKSTGPSHSLSSLKDCSSQSENSTSMKGVYRCCNLEALLCLWAMPTLYLLFWTLYPGSFAIAVMSEKCLLWCDCFHWGLKASLFTSTTKGSICGFLHEILKGKCWEN